MKYLKASILLVILICATYLIYNKYFLHSKDSDLILEEEIEEFKRRPTDPGGIVIPHSNSLIYEKLNNTESLNNFVNVLPDPEQPQELNFKNDPANDKQYDSIDDILAKLDLQETEEHKTLLDAPYHDDSNTENLHEEIHESGLKIIKHPEETNKLYNLNLNSIDSGYKIQLSSAWSEEEAQNEWKKIQSRHNKYLKNAQLVVKKVNANNNKIIYLVMAGNYSSVNQAKLICKKLTQSKQNCIVTK